jgi:large subunit ribosomal protein L25
VDARAAARRLTGRPGAVCVQSETGAALAGHPNSHEHEEGRVMERKLKAEPREADGKGAARRLRAEGKVPGVVYGHGMEPVAVAVDARDLFHILHTDAGANVLIDLEVRKDNHLTLPREIQRDLIRGQFIHVDFLTIRRDEKITVDIPVEFTGESHGVKEGGVIEHHLWEVKVECLPTNVPERIEADISALGVGDGLKAGDLKIPKDVELVTDPEASIMAVVPPPILRLEEEEAAAAEAEAVEGEEAAAEGEGATGDEAAEHAGDGEGSGGSDSGGES